MYVQHFGLGHDPFSIAPDPRFLYMSERHREALAHLLYGLEAGGGFVLLTGEIGAGKTTVCRCFLEQVPPTCQVAYIFNPRLTVVELLDEVCREFGLAPPQPGGASGPVTVKTLLDPLNRFLLESHAAGRNSVLVIDEAQQLSAEVLEQLRLLTNLETSERKLLQIILIGQPELREMLAQPGLEQLAQRVIARYHLGPLDEEDTGRYLRHRLEVAGLQGRSPIGPRHVRSIHRHSAGVPRRINLLCDRALLGAYSQGQPSVDRLTLVQAMREVPAGPARGWRAALGGRRGAWALGLVLMLLATALLGWTVSVLWQDDLAGRIAQAPAPGPAPTAVAIPTQPAVPAAAPSTVPAIAPAAAAPSAVAVPASAAGAPVLDAAALRALIAPAGDPAVLYRNLAARWGASLPAGPVCSVARREGLACHESAGGLTLLRQLDRPALLRLRSGPQGAPRQALLLALGERQAVLELAGARHEVPLAVLGEVWRGEFSTFWRSPPGHPGGVPATLSPTLASWLDEHLSGAPPEASSPGTVESRLQAFQLSQGLQPDGMPGPLTMMALNRRLGIDEPRLLGVNP